jgi:RNA polymerase sigma-B factor
MDTAAIHASACLYASAPSQEALSAALESALPLCQLIAARFRGRGAEDEDLRQVAAMACAAALKGFDPARGLKFTTYATPVITGTVRNHLRDKAFALRTPRGAREMAAQLEKAREALQQALGREPTAREITENLNWDMHRVLDVLALRENTRTVSFDVPDEAGRLLSEQLGNLDDGYRVIEMRADLDKAIAKLTDREKDMLALRFSRRQSQREAAEKMNMTQMQLSRMERRVLGQLRAEMDSP